MHRRMPLSLTAGQALSWTKHALKTASSSDTPDLDARLLVCFVLSCSLEALLSNPDKILDEHHMSQLSHVVALRCDDEPMAYILSSREFFGRTFTVTPAVLIPRPDTETLIETCLKYVQSSNHNTCRILDLCTGSGCIGITLQAELPLSTVTLSDISTDALTIAKINSENLGFPNIEILQGDLFSSCSGRIFDIIVTNPPYIANAWYEETENQVKKEPILALAGGTDGLDIIRRIIAQAPDFLDNQGWVFMECDSRQTAEIASMMRQRGFVDIAVTQDLAGLDRVVSGRMVHA